MYGIEVSIAAFGVGLIVGMTGVGGGALMMPILVLVFGVPARLAVGTDLLFAAFTKTAGMSIHGFRGTVDWQVFRRLSMGSLPAAIITGWFVHRLGVDSHQADKFILHAVAVMMLITAVALLAKNRLLDFGRKLRFGSAVRFKRMQPGATVIAGALLGTLVTLTSIGAGALGSILLTFLYPLRLTPARLVGTDLMHAIPIACVAGASYWIIGSVNWALLGWMLVGSIPGVLVGSHFATRVPGGMLRSILAIVLAATGAKLLFF